MLGPSTNRPGVAMPPNPPRHAVEWYASRHVAALATARVVLLAGWAVSLAACLNQSTWADAATDADGSTPDGLPTDAQTGSSASCLEANQHSDFAWIQDRIFTPSCAAFRDCHQGATAPAGMSLEPGRAWANLVGVRSQLFPAYLRVTAGAPQDSYLMVILGHVPGPLADGLGTMPYNSPLLCIEKRQAIERWIAAGAQP